MWINKFDPHDRSVNVQYLWRVDHTACAQRALQKVCPDHCWHGIFAINDPGALGAYAALERHGKAGQVKIIGFDGQPDGLQAIKDGKIYADPIQFPEKMGRQTITAISKYLAGEEVDPIQLIPAELYRQADGAKDPSLN